jgi:hypothetical protein
VSGRAVNRYQIEEGLEEALPLHKVTQTHIARPFPVQLPAPLVLGAPYTRSPLLTVA